MVCELVEERERVELGPTRDSPRPVLGNDPPSHDACPLGCCPGRIQRAAAAGMPGDGTSAQVGPATGVAGG